MSLGIRRILRFDIELRARDFEIASARLHEIDKLQAVVNERIQPSYWTFSAQVIARAVMTIVEANR